LSGTPTALVIRRATLEISLATWTPDPTFYPSPRLAAGAPPEKLAYVASFDPTRRRNDEMAVVDLDNGSSTYRQNTNAEQTLRCASLTAPPDADHGVTQQGGKHDRSPSRDDHRRRRDPFHSRTGRV
jgi:hypothetical protein